MNISGLIKERRAQLGLTQHQLAAMMRLHVQSVRNYERGMPPARKLIPRLAEILQVDIEDSRKRSGQGNGLTELISQRNISHGMMAKE